MLHQLTHPAGSGQRGIGQTSELDAHQPLEARHDLGIHTQRVDAKYGKPIRPGAARYEQRRK